MITDPCMDLVVLSTAYIFQAVSWNIISLRFDRVLWILLGFLLLCLHYKFLLPFYKEVLFAFFEVAFFSFVIIDEVTLIVSIASVQ